MNPYPRRLWRRTTSLKRRFSSLFMSAAGIVSLTGHPVSASIVYQNDFQGPVGVEWSQMSTSVTPVGSRRFLGGVGSETVSLTLDGIPNHNQITVTFDLYVIGSWDGIEPNAGPDVFGLAEAGGPTRLQTTFSNVDFSQYPDYRQSYPDPYPGLMTHPGKTGASEVNTLGYASTGSVWGDAVYTLSFTFPHATTSLQLNFFSALTTPEPGDPNWELWGLDNVRVEYQTVPEPASIAVLGLGTVGLFIAARRRRSP